MADSNSEQPSLVQGHVQYVKGIAETTVGNVTGSEPWKASGEQDQAAGLSTMKEAGEKRDAAQGYGKAEELAGKLTGCEGMKEEGAQSSK
ncbi:CsbD-like protein [Moelleriella libera RCEF 2490]|uniref:CsbD-like protein n=1 Tax=Moelleriella libera RCEF 2490 TaxID=1081109 RepID=A0A168EK83_9HYPO|nr:CsbD-like protein [Moelleriella libera RCEF 2490]